MHQKIRKYWLSIFAIVIFSACSITNKSFFSQNLYFLYDNYSKNINSEILLLNNSDSTSLLFVKINSKDLLFNKANSSKQLKAFLEISFELIDYKNKNKIVDSTVLYYLINKPLNDTLLMYTIPIQAKKGNDYLVQITTTDLNKKNSRNFTLKYLRKTNIEQNDFLIRDKENKEIMFLPFISDSEKFDVYYRNKVIDSMMVLFYVERENIALNPNIPIDTLNNNYEIPDSIWMWYADSLNYSYDKKGIYRFCNDSILKEGFSLYNFGQTFPVIHTPNELIKPLKYIADSTDKFEPLNSDKFTKLEVDKFWLKRAENFNRSKDLIKIYYNRVINANYYFSSYKPGWQTDRGMIYIIYGLPDGIYRSGEIEKWVYNPIGTGPGLVFIFNYEYHPFNSNNFVLDREKLKYTQWDNAVKLWREGKVVYYQN